MSMTYKLIKISVDHLHLASILTISLYNAHTGKNYTVLVALVYNCYTIIIIPLQLCFKRSMINHCDWFSNVAI